MHLLGVFIPYFEGYEMGTLVDFFLRFLFARKYREIYSVIYRLSVRKYFFLITGGRFGRGLCLILKGSVAGLLDNFFCIFF